MAYPVFSIGGHGPPTRVLFGKNECKNERIGSHKRACAWHVPLIRQCNPTNKYQLDAKFFTKQGKIQNSPWGETNLLRGPFSAKLYAKMKELGIVGTGARVSVCGPPKSANAKIIGFLEILTGQTSKYYSGRLRSTIVALNNLKLNCNTEYQGHL